MRAYRHNFDAAAYYKMLTLLRFGNTVNSGASSSVRQMVFDTHFARLFGVFVLFGRFLKFEGYHDFNIFLLDEAEAFSPLNHHLF